MMKKIVSVAVMLLMGGMMAFAQNATLKTEPLGKPLADDYSQKFIGANSQGVVLLEYSGFGYLRTNQALVCYDYAQNELARVDMGKTKEVNCYGGFLNDNNVDLLMMTENDNGMRVWRERRDMSLKEKGEQLVLADFKGQKGDEFFFAMGTSNDQQLLAGVFVASRKTQEPEMWVGLYSRELNEYWKMKITPTPCSQVYVTDSGEVVLSYVNEKGLCSFTVVDGENENHYGFRLLDEGRVNETRMIRYGDGKILLASALQEEKRTIMPAKEGGPNIDRIDIYCYNIESGKTNVVKHTFTDQETARLCNEKDKSGMKHHWVPFGNIQQSIADATGAYVMVDQMWTIYTDGFPSDFNRVGMMVMRVNADGQVQWSRVWRMENNCHPNLKGIMSYRWQPYSEGIMLAVATHVKNADTPEEKSVKPFKPTKHDALLSVIRLKADGSGNRENFNIDDQGIIGSAHPMGSDKYLLLLSGSRKGQFAHLELK